MSHAYAELVPLPGTEYLDHQRTNTAASPADAVPSGELPVVSTWRALRRLMETTAVSWATVSALDTLNRAGRPLALSELARREGVRAPTVARTVSTLADSGYVTRIRNSTNRRIHLVAITESGAAALAVLHDQIDSAFDQALGSLPPRDRAAVRRATVAIHAAQPQGETSC